MIGSGAWACAAMHIVAQNCLAYDIADEFVDDVRMWVYEEDYQVGDRNLSWQESLQQLHVCFTG